MERIGLTEANISEAARRVADVLRAGSVVLYPTDTLYGLAVDIENPTALERVRAIKGREEGKPFSIVVADTEMLARYAVLTPCARTLAAAHLPGALTLVLDAAIPLPESVTKDGTVATRIPNSAFCLALARELSHAYTATSANRAGLESFRSPDEILAQLGDASKDIALVIDAGVLPPSEGSTIADARGDSPTILRAGALKLAN